MAIQPVVVGDWSQRRSGSRLDTSPSAEIESVGAELAMATARLKELQLRERPLGIAKKLVDDTIAQFEGSLERAPARDQGRHRQGPV